MKAKGYFLLDLERTISNGKPFFWKINRRGYTDVIKEAGIFTKDIAEKIVQFDQQNMTIMIYQDVIFKILGKWTPRD